MTVETYASLVAFCKLHLIFFVFLDIVLVPSYCHAQKVTQPQQDGSTISLISGHDVSVEDFMTAATSNDKDNRKRAAIYLLSLRKVYIASAINRINSKNQQSPEKFLTSVRVLSLLRPSQNEVAETLTAKIRFDASSVEAPAISPPSPYYPTADALERMALPALSSLALCLKSTDSSLDNGETEKIGTNADSVLGQNSICLFRSLDILGPALPDWLLANAKKANKASAQAKFKRLSQFISEHTTASGTRSFEAPIWIEGGHALDGGFDDQWFSGLSPKTVMLQWKLCDALAEKEKGGSPYSDDVTQARNTEEEISKTLGYAEYLLVRYLENPGSVKQARLYPLSPKAQIDTIRLLGAMRSDYAPWVIWSCLERRSVTELIDKDASEETQVCLRALCQIDIPAAKMLINTIPTELALNQRRAATYALSRILGKYSIPYIKQEIAILKEASIGSGDNGNALSNQYQEQAQRMKEMLEIGKEKKWFMGDYYGAHDPHAYDLTFDDAPAPAH